MLKQKLHPLFSLIGAASTMSALYAFGVSLGAFRHESDRLGLAILFLILPLLVEAIGAVGLMMHWWNNSVIRPGRMINILQWIAGVFGIAAIFDVVMRFSRKSSWMFSDPTAVTLDVMLIMTFCLWMAVSHYIHEDSKQRKSCDYC